MEIADTLTHSKYSTSIATLLLYRSVRKHKKKNTTSKLYKYEAWWVVATAKIKQPC